MKDFDYQWKNLPDPRLEFNDARISEFLELIDGKPLTGRRLFIRNLKLRYQTKIDKSSFPLKPIKIELMFGKNNPIKGKYCLDAGCGPGRWTYAMIRLGAKKVDSFDISEEAIKRCRKINPDAFIFDISKLEPNPIYDFVLSWGVLHHTSEPRTNFSKVVSQVKPGGMLHIMMYNKDNDWVFDGFRGKDCVEKHKVWVKMSYEEKMKMCEKASQKYGDTIHAWWDAFNPEFNYSYSVDEIKQWFDEEGFSNIRVTKTDNININGVLSK